MHVREREREREKERERKREKRKGELAMYILLCQGCLCQTICETKLLIIIKDVIIQIVSKCVSITITDYVHNNRIHVCGVYSLLRRSYT